MTKVDLENVCCLFSKEMRRMKSDVNVLVQRHRFEKAKHKVAVKLKDYLLATGRIILQ